MDHFFLLLPNKPVDWLFFISGLILILVFYFLKVEDERQLVLAPIPKGWGGIFLVGFPLMGFLVELIFYNAHPFQSVAFNATIILRLLSIGFPVLYSATFLSFKRGYRVVVLIGVLFSFIVTHNVFTVFESLLIYLVAHSIFTNHSPRDLRDYLFRFLNLVIVVTPIIFVVSYLMFPASMSVRFDFALSVGWIRWLAYMVSITIASLSFNLMINLRKKTTNGHNLSSNILITSPFSKGIILFLVLNLFLFSVSSFWHFQRKSFLQTNSQASAGIINSFALDYYYFFDVGKALTQSYTKELAKIPPAEIQEKLPVLINQIPFFSHLLVYQNTEMIAIYPDDGSKADVDIEENICLGLERSDTVLRLDNLGTSTQYEFSSGFADSSCLIGVTSVEFSPQLNRYVELMDEFSTYWEMRDGFGGVYRSGVTPEIFGDTFYLGGFYREDTFNDGPISLQFQQAYDLEAIVSVIVLTNWTSIVLLAVAHILLYIVFLAVNSIFQRRFESTMANLTALQNYKFEGLMFAEGKSNWLGINQQLKFVARSMQLQVKYLEKGLEIVDKVNEINSFGELTAIIHREKFLQDIGSMTLLMDPELTFVGKSQLEHKYSPQYNIFATKTKTEGYRPFIVKNRNSPKGEINFGSIFYPLEHDGKLSGFLVVLLKGDGKLQPHQDRFLESFSSMLAGTITHRLEKTLKSIESERIDFLVQSYPDPIFVVDHQLNLVLINEAAKELPGVVGEQAKFGVPLRQFIQDKTLMDALSQIEVNGKVTSRVRLASRREYIISIVYGDGNKTSNDAWTLITLQDITQYKEQEQIRAELFETVAQYLQMPIKMTRGNLRMISMVGSLNESQKNYADNMESSINDIDSFVLQMLDRNRLENPANYDMHVVNLDDVLNETVERIIPYTQQQNINIYLERSENLVSRQIEIDRQLFSQAIFSLLENAVQHNHVGGEVSITIEEQDDSFVVCISDNGPGISAVDINRIFVDPSVLEMHGESSRISMGVQLAKSIIERHAGDIWVKSKLGKGSQFFIRIPRYSSTKSRNSSS